MMDKFRAQSERFGTTIITETVSKLDLSARPFKYWREGEEDDVAAFETADTIIMATGASAKRMNLVGEETYWQSGISACAVCDGAVPIFRNKPLAVIGGGDSAAEEATYLTKYASHVYVLVRRGELRASKIMAKRLINHPKVTVLWHVSRLPNPYFPRSHLRRPLPRNARATATSFNPSPSATSNPTKPVTSPSTVSSTRSATNPPQTSSRAKSKQTRTDTSVPSRVQHRRASRVFSLLEMSRIRSTGRRLRVPEAGVWLRSRRNV
jgi:hypothetical protein